MFKAIVGEGFGHVGLCFSIHYAFYACRCFWKAGRLFLSDARFIKATTI
jgi:hypothetical protein